MAQSVVLIIPEEHSISNISSVIYSIYGSLGFDVFVQEEEVQIQDQDLGSYVRITKLGLSSDITEEYATNHLLCEEFRNEVRNRKAYFLVVFNSLDAVNHVLLNVFDSLRNILELCWVDNGYGIVISAISFLQSLLKDKHWDWRGNQGQGLS